MDFTLVIIAGLIIGLILIIIGLIAGILIDRLSIKKRVPGVDVFMKKNITPCLDVFGDDYGQWMPAEKSIRGSVLYNPNTPTETIDTSVIARKPSLNLNGIRSLIRCRLTPINFNPGDMAHQQMVCDLMDSYKPKLPLLYGLKEEERFGAITHDLKTARELMVKYCIVESEYVDDKGLKQQRSKVEIEKLMELKLQEYLKEIKFVKGLMEKDIYIDVARVVNTTQCSIKDSVMKSIWAEIEKLVRYELEQKYGNMKPANPIMYALCVCGGFIMAAVLHGMGWL